MPMRPLATELRIIVVKRGSSLVMAEFSLRLAVILLVTLRVVRAKGQCAATKTVSVSVRHITNATGQPQLTARLEHPTDSFPWQLDVELGSSCKQDSNPNKIIAVSLNGISYRPQIPPGYTMIPGMGYYRPSTHSATWMEARDICAAEGAVLATPSSEREATVIAKDFSYNTTDAENPNHVWVGLHYIIQEGQFVSLEGVPLEETGFSKWHSGEPNGRGTENCMILVKRTVLLADVLCSWKFPYTCKFPL